MGAKAVVILMLALLVPCSAWAVCDDWSRQDTILQATGTALILVDWAQTRERVAHGNRELNALNGDHPSPQEINMKIGLGVIVFGAASCLVPPAWRPIIQGMVIGFEANAVYVNARYGF